MIWHDLMHAGVPLTEKALRTALVYLGLAVLLRLAGKRDLAELNTFDLVVVLLLSNVVQNAIIGDDNSLVGGLFGAALLVTLNAAVARLFLVSRKASQVFQGTPTVLVHDGRLVAAALRREGLRSADVVAAVLRQGAGSIEEVSSAVLEPGGTIVVRQKPETRPASVADLRRVEAKLDALLARGR